MVFVGTKTFENGSLEQKSAIFEIKDKLTSSIKKKGLKLIIIEINSIIIITPRSPEAKTLEIKNVNEIVLKL